MARAPPALVRTLARTSWLVAAVVATVLASARAHAADDAAVLAQRDRDHAANAAALNPEGRLRRVLYPMGLVDVEAAFKLFEGPRGGAAHVMIVDGGLARLGTPDQIRAAHGSADRRAAHLAKVVERDYLHNGLPFDEEAAGARLLWDLERMGADRVAMTPGESGATELSFRWRGRARRVTLVPAWLDDQALPPAVGRFLAAGVDAIFEKASGPSLMTEPELARFVQTAVRRLDRDHGVVVTDDPTWADAAELGLVPLATRGTLPRRFGYLAYRAQHASEHHEPREIAMNPVLAPARGATRAHLRAGRRALEARAATAAEAPAADAIAALGAIANLRAPGGLGRDRVVLDLVDQAARAHGVSTDHTRAARPLLARLAAAEAVADAPGERHEGMTAHRLDSSLLGAIAALRPRHAVRDVVGIVLARARTSRPISPYQLQDFLRATADGDGVPLETMLTVIDRFAGARGLSTSERDDHLRHLGRTLAESIAKTHGVLRHLGRRVDGVDMTTRLSSFDLEDEPVEGLIAMARPLSTAWQVELARDPRSARYLARPGKAPTFRPFATGDRSTTPRASRRPTGRDPRR